MFDEHGYVGTTTNGIAAAAGVSVGSLYQYFPHKDAVLAAVAERHLAEAERALTALAARLRADPPTVEELGEAIVATVVDLNDTDRLHRLLHAGPRTPELADRLAALRAAMVAELSGHLCRLGWDRDPAWTTAALVVSAVDAAVHEVVLAAPDRAGAARALVDLCVAAMRRGDAWLHRAGHAPTADGGTGTVA